MSGPKQIVRCRDFSGGELVEHAKRRDDEAVVRSGCRTLRNVRVLSSGATEQRPGRSALFQEDGRVDKVRMSADYSAYLCFGEGTLTIRNSSGTVIARAWNYSWTAATATQINWAQMDNDVFITFPGQIPKIARWDGGTEWTFLDWEATTTSAGRKMVPFVRIARPGITMALSALTGSVTITFSDDVLNANHVGARMRYYDKQLTITAVTSATSGTATINEVLHPVRNLTFSSNVDTIFSVGEIIEGASSGAQGYVAEFISSTVVRVILISQFFNEPETVVGPSGGEATVTGDAVQTVGPAITVWDEEVMNNYRGWPRSVTVDQNRLIFCDFPAMPQGVAWSANGDSTDFYVGADPDDAIFESVPRKARVYHVMAGADEFMMTDRGIYYVPISESNPLRPGSVAFRRIQGASASAVRPIEAAQGVVYVNNGLNRVLAIVGTGQTAMPWLVRPVSDLHSHLFSGITCLACEEGDGDPPDEQVYAVNAAGTVAVGRYQPGKEWVGWKLWSGEGAVKWVSALGASVVFTSTYSSGTVIEEQDEDRYLDASVVYNAIPTPLGTGAQSAVLLPNDQGTAIGDMTSGAGLAAAFDGVTAITSISFQASATSTSRTITVPAGIQAGDLMVIWHMATGSSLPSTIVPSGFTSIIDFTETNTRSIASYKIALGNESSTTLTFDEDDNNEIMLYVFRANSPLTVVTVGDVESQGTDVDPTSQTVTVSGQPAPLIIFGCYGSTGAVDPRTFSTTKDGEITSATNAYLAYKIYNSGPANTSIDMDDEGDSNMLASFYIQAAAPSAQKSASTTGAVGKTFGQRFKIAKAEVWPPTGVGFTDQANVTISLRAKQGSAPVDYATDGSQLATTGSIADTTSMQTLTSSDTSTQWDHAWVLLTIASGITYVSELRFHSPGLTHGSGELWFLDSATLYVMDGLRVIGTRATDANGEVVLEAGDAFTDEIFGHAFGDIVVEPFIPHAGPGQSVRQTMTPRGLSDVAVAVQNSTGFRMEKWNPNDEDWDVLRERSPYDAGDNEGNEPPLREEVKTFGSVGKEHDPRVRLVKDAPGPIRVLEIGFEVEA